MSLTCIPDTWRLYILTACQVLPVTAFLRLSLCFLIASDVLIAIATWCFLSGYSVLKGMISRAWLVLKQSIPLCTLFAQHVSFSARYIPSQGGEFRKVVYLGLPCPCFRSLFVLQPVWWLLFALTAYLVQEWWFIHLSAVASYRLCMDVLTGSYRICNTIFITYQVLSSYGSLSAYYI